MLPGAVSSDIDASDAETCSCILACSSWVSSWVRSASLLLQRHRVLLDGLLGLLGGLERLVVQALEVLHRLLGRDQLGRERRRGLLVLRRLGLVAGRARLVGEHERLAGRALQLLDLGHLPRELHLELALVADDGGGLLRQRLVLALRLLDRLLDLDLGVGVLVELARQQGHEVLPALDERVGHGVLLAPGPVRRLWPILSGRRGPVAPLGSAEHALATAPPPRRGPARSPSSSPASSATRRGRVVDAAGGRRQRQQLGQPATRPSSPSAAACIRASRVVAGVAQPVAHGDAGRATAASAALGLGAHVPRGRHGGRRRRAWPPRLERGVVDPAERALDGGRLAPSRPRSASVSPACSAADVPCSAERTAAARLGASSSSARDRPLGALEPARGDAAPAAAGRRRRRAAAAGRRAGPPALHAEHRRPDAEPAGDADRAGEQRPGQPAGHARRRPAPRGRAARRTGTRLRSWTGRR